MVMDGDLTLDQASELHGIFGEEKTDAIASNEPKYDDTGKEIERPEQPVIDELRTKLKKYAIADARLDVLSANKAARDKALANGEDIDFGIQFKEEMEKTALSAELGDFDKDVPDLTMQLVCLAMRKSPEEMEAFMEDNYSTVADSEELESQAEHEYSQQMRSTPDQPGGRVAASVQMMNFLMETAPQLQKLEEIHNERLFLRDFACLYDWQRGQEKEILEESRNRLVEMQKRIEKKAASPVLKQRLKTCENFVNKIVKLEEEKEELQEKADAASLLEMNIKFDCFGKMREIDEQIGKIQAGDDNLACAKEVGLMLIAKEELKMRRRIQQINEQIYEKDAEQEFLLDAIGGGSAMIHQNITSKVGRTWVEVEVRELLKEKKRLLEKDSAITQKIDQESMLQTHHKAANQYRAPLREMPSHGPSGHSMQYVRDACEREEHDGSYTEQEQPMSIAARKFGGGIRVGRRVVQLRRRVIDLKCLITPTDDEAMRTEWETEEGEDSDGDALADLGTSAGSACPATQMKLLCDQAGSPAPKRTASLWFHGPLDSAALMRAVATLAGHHHALKYRIAGTQVLTGIHTPQSHLFQRLVAESEAEVLRIAERMDHAFTLSALQPVISKLKGTDDCEDGESRGIGFWKKELERIRSECGLKAEDCQTITGVKAALQKFIAKQKELKESENKEEDVFAGAAALFGLGPENALQAGERNLAELNNLKGDLDALLAEALVVLAGTERPGDAAFVVDFAKNALGSQDLPWGQTVPLRILCVSLEQSGSGAGRHLLVVQPHPLVIGAGVLPSLMSELSWFYRSELGEKLPSQKPPCLLSHGAHDALVKAGKDSSDASWAASALSALPACKFGKAGESARDSLPIGPLDPAVAAKLNAICEKAAVPMSSLILSCYAAVVSEKITMSKDVCIGLVNPVLGEALMPSSVLPVLVQLQSSWSTEDVALKALDSVADSVAKAVANSSSWIDLHMKNPEAKVSEVVFAWGSEGGAWQRDLQGLQLSMTAGAKSAKTASQGSCCPFSAISLEMYSTEDLNIKGHLEFASDIVPQSQALMMMSSLKQTLEKIANGSPSVPDNSSLAVPDALLLPGLQRLQLETAEGVDCKSPSICVWATGHVDPTALARAFAALGARRSSLTSMDGGAKASEMFQRIRVSDASQAVRAASQADVAFSLAELREALGFSGPPPQPEKLSQALKELKTTSELWTTKFESLEVRLPWADGPEKIALEKVQELTGTMGPFLGWAVGEGIQAAQCADRSSEASLYAEFVREAMKKRGDSPPPREQRCGLRLLCVDLHGKSLFLLQGDSEKVDQLSLAVAWRELLWLYEVHVTLADHKAAPTEEFSQLSKDLTVLQKELKEHAKCVGHRVLSAYEDLKVGMKKYRTNRKGGLQLVDWAKQHKAEVESDVDKLSNDNPFSFIFGSREESFGDVTRDFAETVATTAAILEENETLVSDFETLHRHYQEVESHADEVEQWLEETKTMAKTIEDQAGRDVCAEVLRDLHVPLGKDAPDAAVTNELLVAPLNPYVSPLSSLSESRRRALVVESESEHIRLVAAWGWKLALAESTRMGQLNKLASRLGELVDLLSEYREQYPDEEAEDDDEWVAGGEEREREEESMDMEKIEGEDCDGVRRTAVRRNVRMRRFQKAGAMPAGLKSLGSVVKNGRRKAQQQVEGTATTSDGLRAELAEDGWELVGEEEVEEIFREEHDLLKPIDQILQLADAGRDLVTEMGAHAGNVTGILVKHTGGVVTHCINPIHKLMVKARVQIQCATTPLLAQAAAVAFPFIAIAAVGTNRIMVTYQRHSCSITAKMYQGIATNVANLNAAVVQLTAPITTELSFYATRAACHVNAAITPMTTQIGNVTGLAMTRMNAWIAPMKYEMVAIMTPIGLQVNQFTAPFAAQTSAALGPMWRHWDAMWATPGAAMQAFMMPAMMVWGAAMSNITSPDQPLSNMMQQMGMYMTPYHAAIGQLCMPIHQSIGAITAPITATFDANFKPVECAVATAVGPIVANAAATFGPFGDRMNATMYPVNAQINCVVSPAVAEVNKVVMPYVAYASAEATVATAQIHSHTTAVLGYAHSTLTDISGTVNEAIGHTDLMSGACGVAGVAVNGVNGSFGGALPKLQCAVANAPADLAAGVTGEVLKVWEKVDGEVAEWTNWSGAQAHSAIVHVKNVHNGRDITNALKSKTTQVTEKTRHIQRQTYKRGNSEMMEVDITTDTAVNELRYGERQKTNRKALPSGKKSSQTLKAVKN